MKNLKAVFWDLDGTIADTEMEGHRIAFNRSFASFKLNWNWDYKIYKKLLSVSGGKNRIRHYSREINVDLDYEQISSIHKLKQTHYTQIVKEGKIPIRTGVKRLVQSLSSLNVKQLIVTTSGLEAVNSMKKYVFDKADIFFDGFVTYEDVHFTKPNPEAYLLALRKLSVDKHDCIVIEDSLIGLKSALSAGINCLVTNSPWNEISVGDFNLASAVVDSLGDTDFNTKLFLGPKMSLSYVDHSYLIKLLK